jgi:hypothetical protein
MDNLVAEALPAQLLNAVTKIFALVPLNVMLHKDGSKTLPTLAAWVRIAPQTDVVFIRHVLDMVDAVVVDGNLPLIWHLFDVLLQLALIKNAVFRFATLPIITSVVVESNGRIPKVL